MTTLRTVDLRNDFKKVSDLVMSGEKVLITRPRNENLVVISEREYNEMAKARSNAKYLAVLDDSASRVAESRVVSITMDELEAIGVMSSEELFAFIAKKQAYSTTEPIKPKRNLGFLSGPSLPDSFFDPLPEEDLQAWGR